MESGVNFLPGHYGVPLELTSCVLRRGKWTPEEETFADKIRDYFSQGLLDLRAGTTLRTYLSEVLHCDPMRITKKFTKEESVGKQMYVPREPSSKHRERMLDVYEDLEEHRDRWYQKLLLAERHNLRKETIPTKSTEYKSFEYLERDTEAFATNEQKIRGLLGELLSDKESNKIMHWVNKAHQVLIKKNGHGRTRRDVTVCAEAPVDTAPSAIKTNPSRGDNGAGGVANRYKGHTEANGILPATTTTTTSSSSRRRSCSSSSSASRSGSRGSTRSNRIIGDSNDIEGELSESSDTETDSLASIYEQGVQILPEVHTRIVEAFREQGGGGSVPLDMVGQMSTLTSFTSSWDGKASPDSGDSSVTDEDDRVILPKSKSSDSFLTATTEACDNDTVASDIRSASYSVHTDMGTGMGFHNTGFKATAPVYLRDKSRKRNSNAITNPFLLRKKPRMGRLVAAVIPADANAPEVNSAVEALLGLHG